jgi:hypothetical protein
MTFQGLASRKISGLVRKAIPDKFVSRQDRQPIDRFAVGVSLYDPTGVVSNKPPSYFYGRGPFRTISQILILGNKNQKKR